MRLDPTMLRYLSKDEFRVLTAVEMGQKNHELVPAQLVEAIAGLKRGGSYRALQVLLKHKLLHHESKKYDGYKLTYLGYDFLALRAMCNRGTLSFVGNQIGVGKESDVFVVANSEDEEMALKLHRLGRISFRSIKNKRDYLLHRKNASWLYMSRLAALKEYAYMKVLHEHDFPVPKPIDINRHCVVMQLLKATPLCQVRELGNPGQVYSKLMDLILKFASHGLIHCDFNEFNLLIDDDENIYIIDFPQMVSTSHLNAKEYFDRDVQCIRTFFLRKLGFDGVDYPVFERDVEKKVDLDTLVKASGFSKQQEEELAQYTSQVKETQDDDGNEDEDDDSDEGDENGEDGEDDEALAGKLAESLELDEGESSASKPKHENKSKRATGASSSSTGKSDDAEVETTEKLFSAEGEKEEEQNPAGLKSDGDTGKLKKKSADDRNGKDEEAKDGNDDDNDDDEDGGDDDDEDDDGGVSEEIRHRVRRQVQRKFTSRNGSRNQTKNREKRRLKEDMKSSH